MNTCPVYRRSGGHSYGSTVPGPIGAVLAPGLDLARYASLPFASTLCGSCTAVCPVKIDLDGQLFRWRQRVIQAGHGSAAKSLAMKAAGAVLARPRRARLGWAIARAALQMLPRRLTTLLSGAWGRTRELPAVPPASFHAWYRARGKP
jgi:L-lactate dehydrogenase complex protein LldF